MVLLDIIMFILFMKMCDTPYLYSFWGNVLEWVFVPAPFCACKKVCVGISVPRNKNSISFGGGEA